MENGKSKTKAQKLSKNGLTDKELELLDSVEYIYADKNNDFSSYLLHKIGDAKTIQTMLDGLYEKGFIETASVEKSLQMEFGDTLKVLLKKHSLSGSGNKYDLVKRIVENLPEEELAKIRLRYALTAKGREELAENDFVDGGDGGYRKRGADVIPSRNGLYPDEIAMLYCAKNFYVDGNNQFPKYWRYDYGVPNPQKVLDELVKKGFLETGNAKETLAAEQAAVMKELLKKNSMPASGNKETLAKRILDNFSDEQLKQIRMRYALTPKGEEELSENEYVIYFHQRHEYVYTEAYIGPNKSTINKLIKDNQNGKKDKLISILSKQNPELAKVVEKSDMPFYTIDSEGWLQFAITVWTMNKLINGEPNYDYMKTIRQVLTERKERLQKKISGSNSSSKDVSAYESVCTAISTRFGDEDKEAVNSSLENIYMRNGISPDKKTGSYEWTSTFVPGIEMFPLSIVTAKRMNALFDKTGFKEDMLLSELKQIHETLNWHIRYYTLEELADVIIKQLHGDKAGAKAVYDVMYKRVTDSMREKNDENNFEGDWTKRAHALQNMSDINFREGRYDDALENLIKKWYLYAYSLSHNAFDVRWFQETFNPNADDIKEFVNRIYDKHILDVGNYTLEQCTDLVLSDLLMKLEEMDETYETLEELQEAEAKDEKVEKKRKSNAIISDIEDKIMVYYDYSKWANHITEQADLIKIYEQKQISDEQIHTLFQKAHEQYKLDDSVLKVDKFAASVCVVLHRNLEIIKDIDSKGSYAVKLNMANYKGMCKAVALEL